MRLLGLAFSQSQGHLRRYLEDMYGKVFRRYMLLVNEAALRIPPIELFWPARTLARPPQQPTCFGSFGNNKRPSAVLRAITAYSSVVTANLNRAPNLTVPKRRAPSLARPVRLRRAPPPSAFANRRPPRARPGPPAGVLRTKPAAPPRPARRIETRRQPRAARAAAAAPGK